MHLIKMITIWEYFQLDVTFSISSNISVVPIKFLEHL